MATDDTLSPAEIASYRAAHADDPVYPGRCRTCPAIRQPCDVNILLDSHEALRAERDQEHQVRVRLEAEWNESYDVVSEECEALRQRAAADRAALAALVAAVNEFIDYFDMQGREWDAGGVAADVAAYQRLAGARVSALDSLARARLAAPGATDG